MARTSLISMAHYIFPSTLATITQYIGLELRTLPRLEAFSHYYILSVYKMSVYSPCSATPLVLWAATQPQLSGRQSVDFSGESSAGVVASNMWIYLTCLAHSRDIYYLSWRPLSLILLTLSRTFHRLFDSSLFVVWEIPWYDIFGFILHGSRSVTRYVLYCIAVESGCPIPESRVFADRGQALWGYRSLVSDNLRA
ncbi:hypothetical protein HOY82DRAFT_189004 [Tuber indicum]|nr:hypothetical protein HOY82DRAFT_189004 [Tuber indicum]